MCGEKVLEVLNTGIQVLLLNVSNFQYLLWYMLGGINREEWLPRDQKQGSWHICVVWSRDNHHHAEDVRGTVGEKENYLWYILEMGLKIFAERRKKSQQRFSCFRFKQLISVCAIH